MSVPTHGPGCRTLLWATNCPDCEDRVYFFACNCGSKVFFDQTGGSWPRHADRCIPYLIRSARQAGLSFSDIRASVHEASRRTGKAVPAPVLDTLREQEYDETGREIVVVVVPADDAHTVEGRILSSALQVNFLRRFGYDDTVFGRALLGRLLDEPYVELRVRAMADPVSGVCVQLECFLRRKVWDTLGLHDGCSVAVMVTPRKLRADRSIWVADNVERLDSAR